MAYVPRDLSTQVAVMVGEGIELDRVADEIATLARAEAAKHNHTGGFEGSIHVEKVPGKKGVTDREVVADDPASTFIEMGHLSRGHTWVRGLHILRNAALKVRGGK